MVPFTTPRASVVAESMHSQPFDPVVLIDTDPVTANVRTSTTTADRGIASAQRAESMIEDDLTTEALPTIRQIRARTVSYF